MVPYRLAVFVGQSGLGGLPRRWYLDQQAQLDEIAEFVCGRFRHLVPTTRDHHDETVAGERS